MKVLVAYAYVCVTTMIYMFYQSNVVLLQQVGLTYDKYSIFHHFYELARLQFQFSLFEVGQVMEITHVQQNSKTTVQQIYYCSI